MNCREVKTITYLDLSHRLVRTAILPTLWQVSLAPSCCLVLDGFKAEEMPHRQQPDTPACHLSSHSSIRDPTVPHVQYTDMAQQEDRMLLCPMGVRAASGPATRFLSVRKRVLFLPANLPTAFFIFYPFS